MEKMGMTHTSHSVHVIENDRGIVDRTTTHELVYNFEDKFVISFFGAIFGVKYTNKHIMLQTLFREQNMIRGCLVLPFVINHFEGKQAG